VVDSSLAISCFRVNKVFHKITNRMESHQFLIFYPKVLSGYRLACYAVGCANP
jgi:hypothetical protein